MHICYENQKPFYLIKPYWLVIWFQVHVHGKAGSDQRNFKVFKSLSTLEIGSSK